MTARHFAIWSIVSRFIWATATLALAALLPTHVFAEYAFLQISSAILSQLALGVLSNVVTAKFALKDGSVQRNELALASALYGAGVAAASYPLLLLSAALGAPHLDLLGALGVSLLVFSNHVAATANSYLTSESMYGPAIANGFLQTGLYLLLLVTLSPTGGAEVATVVAVAQLIAGMYGILSRTRGPQSALVKELTSIARWHLKSTLINASYFPASLLLWYLAAVLATKSSSDMAAYGVGNQVSSLFLFAPAALAPLVILKISNGLLRPKHVYAISVGFAVLGITGSILALAAGSTLSHLLPRTVALSVPTLSVALIMAGLIAARSPFAWKNQIEHRTSEEVIVSIVGFAVTATMLLAPGFGSLDLMTARTLAALACVVVSGAGLWLRSRRARDRGAPPSGYT